MYIMYRKKKKSSPLHRSNFHHAVSVRQPPLGPLHCRESQSHKLDMMEERKWEDMNMDCLVNVLARVGMESLLLDVPFVCKSWYKATLNPLCWRQLVFPKMSGHSLWSDSDSDFESRIGDVYQINGHFSATTFIKSVIKRSNGSATYLKLPKCCTEEALLYVADECPELRTLVLSYGLPDAVMSKLPSLVSKWENLKCLVSQGSSFQMMEVIVEISAHCKNFIGLGLTYSGRITEDVAMAIIGHLPNIKELSLSGSQIARGSLVSILECCKKLTYLNVKKCIGFDEGDEEIRRLAAHITTFKDEGSMLYDEDDYYVDNDYEVFDGYVSG